MRIKSFMFYFKRYIITISAWFLMFYVLQVAALSNQNIGKPQHGYKCKVGDLWFQHVNCGSICRAIDRSTVSLQMPKVNHVAMVVSCKPSIQLAEAVSSGVGQVAANKFILRSRSVVVGRVLAKFADAIPAAVAFVKQQYGKPYNASFIDNTHSYYCSQLIVAAFAASHPSPSIFVKIPMRFNPPHTDKPLVAWKNYYKTLHLKIPQGAPGSNPQQLLGAKSIHVVAQIKLNSRV